MTGPAQTRATPNEVLTVAGPSPGGRFRSAYPLWDGTNRILVSWSQCRLLDTTVTPNAIVPCTPQRLADPNVQTAPPLYSAYIFDPADNTFKPLFQPVEGVMITDLVAAQPRTLPAVILDKVPVIDFDPDLQTRGRRHPRHPQRLRLRRHDAQYRRRQSPHRHAGQSRACALRTSARRASCASRRPCRSATRTWASRTSTTPPSAA